MRHTRYAIYTTLKPGPLADFTAAWLGWDVSCGQERSHPTIAGLTEDIAALTESPRKYGFHGTIKPPFRLADGTDLADLVAALEAWSANSAPVRLAGLHLSVLGHFLALVPDGDQEPLAALARDAVMTFDRFRAPARDAEIARRRAAGLSEAQDALLLRWGYPYVLEEFRYHMTLTGALSPETLERTEKALRPVMAPLLPRPFHIDHLTLAGERVDGRFETIHDYPLGR